MLAALLLLGGWTGLLTYLLVFHQPDWATPWPYLLALLQTHLYTGLFITAHDAVHGVVSTNKHLNNLLGTVAAGLFAFNWFPRMQPKHHDHHQNVGSDKDPDFHNGRYDSFLPTYLPHRGEHAPANSYRSRSLRRQHAWAFVTCYFFGYHYEYHDQPYLPWWRLWRTKSS